MILKTGTLFKEVENDQMRQVDVFLFYCRSKGYIEISRKAETSCEVSL